MVEIIGLVATVFVLLSFLFDKPLYIRAVNLIGAVLFVVYGALLGATSVWLLNGCLIAVQIYYIVRLRKEPKRK